MRKRHILVCLLMIIFCLPFIYGSLSNLSNTAEAANFVSYSAAIKNDKPSVVLFYANWCSYCRKFMPIMNSLSNTYSNDFNFVKVNIDIAGNSALSREYNVKSLPTVYIIEPRYKVKKEVSPYSYSSVNAMKSELDYYLNHRR